MITAIVLAAGESRRMGWPKPLLRFGHTTFLDQIVSVLRQSKVDRITVVLGAEAALIRRSINLSGTDVVVNPDFRQGQLSSLIAGLRSVPPQTEAVLICLADNPLITPEIVNRLVDGFRQTQSPIVVPVCMGTRGHPTLFSKELFPELLCAPAGEGARHVLHAHPDQVSQVDVSEQTVLVRIDTPEDYRAHFGADPVPAVAVPREKS